jgi:uncharacterized protein (DUF427 family)
VSTLLILAGGPTIPRDLSEGRRSWLACDLARSGRKIRHLGCVRKTLFAGFTTATQPIAGKPAPTPSAEARASSIQSDQNTVATGFMLLHSPSFPARDWPTLGLPFIGPAGVTAMKIPGPDHPITLSPLPGSVTVHFKGARVAQSNQALELKEASYPPVIYIPRSDISIEHYVRTEHRTHCPYKGDAQYFSLSANGETAENAVWTYEEAYPSVKEIEGHVAFYPDKVTLDIR